MLKLFLQIIKDSLKKNDDSIIEIHKRLDRITYDITQLNAALSALAHVVNRHNLIINEASAIQAEINESKSIDVDLPNINSRLKERKPN